MSLYKDASLVMIPSAYKDGKLYSIRPTDGSGDFTFSRGSNLAATRVDVNGLIEKGRENVLLYSNGFSNADWTKIRSSVTSGQTGYDGSTNAFAFNDSTDDSSHLLFNEVSITSQVTTFSVYAKAGDADFLAVRLGDTANYVYFNLANGTLGTIHSSYIDAAITAVGGGWYRCSATKVVGSSSNLAVMLPTQANNSNTYAGLGTAALYIQDAQLEAGLVATDYIETGASTAQAGILEDMPRLDYSGSCPALLLEPQRTNLITQSEYLGSYTPILATISDNAATSPEGVINAGSFVENTSSGRHRTQTNSFAVSSGSTYTLSMFVKNKSGSRLLCINADYLFNARSYFDIIEGVVEGTDSGSASIEDYGNGWYRCSVTGTSSITGSSIAYIGLEDNAVDNGYVGDGTSGHYWYGIQVESGSYPTSYIPTYGSSVTRSFDNMNNQAIVGDLSNNYTFFFDAVRLLDGDGTQRWFYTTGLNGTNFQVYFISGGIDGRIRLFFRAAGGSSDSSITWELGPQQGSRYKIAIVRSEGSLKLFADGSLIGENTNNVPDELTYYNVFAGNGAQQLNQYAIFPTALTDSECIALTTI